MNNISIHEKKVSPIAETYQEPTIEHSTEINIDLYSTERWSVPTFYERRIAVDNWFDGLMGYSPELPHFIDYWNGYALGYREYYCGLLGVEISIGEIPADRSEILATA